MGEAWYTGSLGTHGGEGGRKCSLCCCHCLAAKPCPPLLPRHGQCPPGSFVYGFPRQEYWRGLPFPFQGIFLTQGLNVSLPHWGADSFPQGHLGSPPSLQPVSIHEGVHSGGLGVVLGNEKVLIWAQKGLGLGRPPDLGLVLMTQSSTNQSYI